MVKYKIIERQQGRKQMIINAKTGEKISNWHGIVYLNGLVKGASNYYLVANDGKCAIFHKDDKDTPVMPWTDTLSTYDNFKNVVNGKSEYYIFRKKNGQEAIFHISDKENPISNWSHKIFTDGLVNGESDYYIAEDDTGRHTIFHKNDKGNSVSQETISIPVQGLVNGKSDYYVLEDKYGVKRAIFHKDDKDTPVSAWHDWICLDKDNNLITNNQSDYYIAKEKGQYVIFHKDDKETPVLHGFVLSEDADLSLDELAESICPCA